MGIGDFGVSASIDKARRALASGRGGLSPAAAAKAGLALDDMEAAMKRGDAVTVREAGDRLRAITDTPAEAAPKSKPRKKWMKGWRA